MLAIHAGLPNRPLICEKEGNLCWGTYKDA